MCFYEQRMLLKTSPFSCIFHRKTSDHHGQLSILDGLGYPWIFPSGKLKSTPFQPFAKQHKTSGLPSKHLHTVSGSVNEYEQITATGIFTQTCCNQSAESVISHPHIRCVPVQKIPGCGYREHPGYKLTRDLTTDIGMAEEILSSTPFG